MAISCLEVFVKNGWLKEELERSAKCIAEWRARPLTQAQEKRAREMSEHHPARWRELYMQVPIPQEDD